MSLCTDNKSELLSIFQANDGARDVGGGGAKPTQGNDATCATTFNGQYTTTQPESVGA